LHITELDEFPHCRVGLVLGTPTPTLQGRPNHCLGGRIQQASAKLYKAGKVNYLQVSSLNSSPYHHEPSAMREALVAQGVPTERTYRDYAGKTMLDSVPWTRVDRAKQVFGEQRFTNVSQQYYNQRAVFIARECGLEAIGFNAPDVPEWFNTNTQFRERLARVQIVLDLF